MIPKTIRIKAFIRTAHAAAWYRWEQLRFQWQASQVKYRAAQLTAFLLFVAVVSILAQPHIQRTMHPYYSNADQLASLTSIFESIGAALVGVAGIAFSFVMFAMQVNVERMPHGMFRRISADAKLLGGFGLVFVLAFSVTLLALLRDLSLVGWASIYAFWATIFIGVLFLYLYKRALHLINPVQQLVTLRNVAARDLATWRRRAERARPLFPNTPDQDSNERNRDLPLMRFYGVNALWTSEAHRAIAHALSIAMKAAANGDHEIERTAIAAIAGVNAAYIAAKGRTFFAPILLIDHPRSSDAFINLTLEEITQAFRLELARGDQKSLDTLLDSLKVLTGVYSAIEYVSEQASAHHANLAAGYLYACVESVIPHNMPDRLMHGVRALGECAVLIAAKADATAMTTVANKIGTLAAVGLGRENHRPVTMESMRQLSKLTLYLMVDRRGDTRYAFTTLRNSILLIAKMFLKLPDTPLAAVHSTFLGPVYSGTDTSAFLVSFTALANELLKDDADAATVNRVASNIELWAEGLSHPHRELIRDAVNARSGFTLDLVHWLCHVGEVLVAISGANKLRDDLAQKLRRHATNLMWVVTWAVPDETAEEFLQPYHFEDSLFRSAVDAHNRGQADVRNEIGRMLVSFGTQIGKYEPRAEPFQMGMIGAVVLALSDPDDGDGLAGKVKTTILKEISDCKFTLDDRAEAALALRARARSRNRDGYSYTLITRVCGEFDSARLRPVLLDLAEAISPERSHEEGAKDEN